MKYIKDCTILTPEFIDGKEWDVIELNLRIDSIQLLEYYEKLKKDFSNLLFNFNSKEYLRTEIYETFIQEGRVGNYVGNVEAWSISWPIDRDIPCPSRLQANLDLYPELKPFFNEKEIDHIGFLEAAHPQEKYKFGILVKMLDILTEKALRQILIARHPPKLEVLTHVDSDLKKLHIPLYTNPNAVFTFGYQNERVYHMEVGKLYIINPSVPHGTNNLGNTERVHLLSRIDLDFIPKVLTMTGIIE